MAEGSRGNVTGLATALMACMVDGARPSAMQNVLSVVYRTQPPHAEFMACMLLQGRSGGAVGCPDDVGLRI